MTGTNGHTNTNGLTRREAEVLKLIAEGLSSKEIARHLGVSFKTVVSHRTHLLEKVGVHNVVGLVRYAVREKVIEP